MRKLMRKLWNIDLGFGFGPVFVILIGLIVIGYTLLYPERLPDVSDRGFRLGYGIFAVIAGIGMLVLINQPGDDTEDTEEVTEKNIRKVE